MTTTIPFKSAHSTASEFSEPLFYRGFQLRCRSEKSKCIGEVYKQGVRIAYCESMGQSSCVQHLRGIVDELIKDEIDERKNALPSTLAFADAIESAFEHMPDSIQKLLAYFQAHPAQAFSINQLMRVSGHKNTTDISLLLAQLGRLLCDLIAYEPPTPIDGRDPFLAIVVAAPENCSNAEKPITLGLTPEFSRAIHAIKRPLG